MTRRVGAGVKLGALDEEFARALEVPAFSSQDAMDRWMCRWCERCARETAGFCPLRDVAYMSRTPDPQVWKPDGRDRYTCAAWMPE